MVGRGIEEVGVDEVRKGGELGEEVGKGGCREGRWWEGELMR